MARLAPAVGQRVSTICPAVKVHVFSVAFFTGYVGTVDDVAVIFEAIALPVDGIASTKQDFLFVDRRKFLNTTMSL